MEMKIGTYLEPIAGWRFILSSNVIDFLPGEILHWKEFNPDYDQTGTGHLYGMSRLKPILNQLSVQRLMMHCSGVSASGRMGYLQFLGDGK